MMSGRSSSASRARLEVIVAVLFDEAPHRLKGRTYVQKITFLLQKEADTDGFDFEAHDYGPWSRELNTTLDYLVEYDYVTESEEEQDDGLIRYYYDDGPCIEEVFGHGDHGDLRDAARTVFEEYPTKDLGELIERVYAEYPEMARNSVY